MRFHSLNRLFFKSCSNCSIVTPSTPAAPLLALTLRYASQISCLEMSNDLPCDLDSLTGSSQESWLTTNEPGRPAPFAPAPLQGLHRYYEAVRPPAAHQYSPPRSFSCLGFSLPPADVNTSTGIIAARGSHVPCQRPNRARAASMPDNHQGSRQVSPWLIPGQQLDPGSDCHRYAYDTSSAVHLRSPSRSPPDASRAPFPWCSSPRLIHRSNPRRFTASPCRAAVEGPPPSPAQHRNHQRDLLHRNLQPRSWRTIIGVAAVSQPPISGVLRVARGQSAQLAAQVTGFVPIPTRTCTPHPVLRPLILGVVSSVFPSGVLRDQNRLDVDVQLMQVDIREDRRHHPALRTAAQRFMVPPVFQVLGLQPLFDEPQKPVVVDLLRQDPDHNIMIQSPEAIGDITLDEPRGPGPESLYLPQRGVAASLGSESVRVVGERRLVVRLQEQADHLPDEFVRPGRQSQRS